MNVSEDENRNEESEDTGHLTSEATEAEEVESIFEDKSFSHERKLDSNSVLEMPPILDVICRYKDLDCKMSLALHLYFELIIWDPGGICLGDELLLAMPHYTQPACDLD